MESCPFPTWGNTNSRKSSLPKNFNMNFIGWIACRPDYFTWCNTIPENRIYFESLKSIIKTTGLAWSQNSWFIGKENRVFINAIPENKPITQIILWQPDADFCEKGFNFKGVCQIGYTIRGCLLTEWKIGKSKWLIFLFGWIGFWVKSDVQIGFRLNKTRLFLTRNET